MSKILGSIFVIPRMEDSMASGAEDIWLNCMLWYIFLIEKQLIFF